MRDRMQTELDISFQALIIHSSIHASQSSCCSAEPQRLTNSVSPSEARAEVGSWAEALGLRGLGCQEPSQLSTVLGDKEMVAESGQKPDMDLPQLNSMCIRAVLLSAASREKLVSFFSFQRPLPCLGWCPLPPSSGAVGLHLYDPLPLILCFPPLWGPLWFWVPLPPVL